MSDVCNDLRLGRSHEEEQFVSEGPSSRRVVFHCQPDLTKAPGALSVDEYGQFGRNVLALAAAAFNRAEHHHGLGKSDPARNGKLRKALKDAIDACRRIEEAANLTGASIGAAEFRASAAKALAALNPRFAKLGSPGRPAYEAAARAVADAWKDEPCEDTRRRKRQIPTTGRVRVGHSLPPLLDAVSKDLFGSTGWLSVSLLRNRKRHK